MRKTAYIFLSIIILLLLLVLYYSYQYVPDEILANEARENVRLGKYDYIVDVRTKDEWNEGHLPNAINIPIGELVTTLPKQIPNKNTSILFVCKKGTRASGVVTIAHKLGYSNVQAMIGNYKELKY